MTTRMTEVIARFACHDGWWEFYLPHPPVPAARPRVSKWGTYYPKTYRTWRLDTEASLARFERPVTTVQCAVYATVYVVCKRPKKLTREWPRGDSDNYAKAVLDAITRSGLVWKDDDQVVLHTAGKRYAEPGEEPHTYVLASTTMTESDRIGLYGQHHVGHDVYDLPPEDRESLDG